MNRRDFLRFLIAAPILAQTELELDIDKLLWVPGEKTIFIPDKPYLSMSQIVAIEIERILPHIKTLFEREDIFYAALNKTSDI